MEVTLIFTTFTFSNRETDFFILMIERLRLDLVCILWIIWHRL